MSRVIIIHGSYGSPDGNWSPWLKKELESSVDHVLVPALPTPEGQSLDAWKRSFMDQVGELDEDAVLIGHSLAGAFILRLLEETPRPVRGVVIVSGFLGSLGIDEFDSVNFTFTDHPVNWEAVNRNRGRAVLLTGEDDPYVPLSKGLDLSKAMHVPLIVVPGGKHLNKAAGLVEFPLLLQCLHSFVLSENG